MLTIEEYMERAKYIGRIQGAAETIEDEATRDGIYGDAEYLFGYLVEDARADYRFVERNEIDELLCQTPTDPARAETNFDRLTQSPESLAVFLAQNAEACVRGECTRPEDPTLNECVQCMIDWLREEHTDD